MARDRELEPGLARLIDAREAGDLDVLLEALGGDPEYVHIAARMLAAAGDTRATPKLVELLDSPRGAQRAAAAFGLAQLGAPAAARERLVELALDDGIPSVREWSAVAIGRYADPAAVQLLIGLLTDPARNVRLGAVRGLVEAGDPAAAEVIRSVQPRFRQQPVEFLLTRRKVLLALLELEAKGAATPWEPAV